jgi:hypothetical protein
VCSGQTVFGQISDSDIDDVYKISGATNQTLTISMSGTGVGGAGNADLYLYPPGTADVTDPFYARSIGFGNNEFIQVVRLKAAFGILIFTMTPMAMEAPIMPYQ